MLENNTSEFAERNYYKVCSTCKEMKFYDQFSFSNKEKNIRRSQCKDCVSAYYQKNRQERIIYQNIYRFNNIERENNRSKQWNKDNKVRYKANQDSYRENNKEKLADICRKSKNKKKDYYSAVRRIKDKVINLKIKDIMIPLQDNKCIYCLKEFNWHYYTDNPEINHYIPLSKLYEANVLSNEVNLKNIVVCCMECRGKKKNKNPSEYFSSIELKAVCKRIKKVQQKLNDLITK